MEIGLEQRKEFGDIHKCAHENKNFLVDDMGLLKYSGRDEPPVVVPGSFLNRVLGEVHGSRLTGHYRLRKTLAKLLPRFWWGGVAKETAINIKNCLSCVLPEDRQPGKQAYIEAHHPESRFQVMVFDVQTITTRSGKGNLKALPMVDVFTRFIRARAIPEEKADTIASVVIDEWISILGMMEYLLSHGGPNLTGEVMNNLTDRLGIGRMQKHALHP